MKYENTINFDLSHLELNELIELYNNIFEFIDFLENSTIVVEKGEKPNG